MWRAVALVICCGVALGSVALVSGQTVGSSQTVFLPVVQRIGPSSTPTRQPSATLTGSPTLQPSATVTTAPTSTRLPSPTSTATPVPPLVVDAIHDTSYRYGDALYIVGEVVNRSPRTAYNARIAARYYDDQHALVAVSEGYARLSRIDAQQRMSFYVFLYNAPTTITSYDLTVTAQPETILDYQPLTVISTKTRNNNGVEVFGEIRNDAAVPINNIVAAATFYNADGDVVHVDADYMNVNLAPGQTDVYQMSTFRDFVFTRVEVQAQGYTN